MFDRYILILILSFALLGTSVLMLSAKDLLLSCIISTLASLIGVLSYVLLSANDVAITEAAVGSSISSIFLLMGISYFGKNTQKATQYPTQNGVIALLCIFIFGILAFALIFCDFKEFGENGIQMYDAMRKYITDSKSDFEIPNIVTSILGGYRGFDTLLETMVIVVAALGMHNILHDDVDQ